MRIPCRAGRRARHARTETTIADYDLPAPPPANPARLALFLDIDGTLLDFAGRPQAVAVAPALPDLLWRLHDLLDGAFALLSGRPLAQIDALFGLPRIAAAGLHGAELRLADGGLRRSARDTQLPPGFADRARALLAGTPGVLVEDKGAALALHYRAAPDAQAAVQRVAVQLSDMAGENHTLQHGNLVIEIKPAASDKGSALAALMDAAPFAGREPWMLGDDLTDEHAFAEVDARDGTSIIVGARRPTVARHALADPAAVHAWLSALVRP
jgi:trehalose 6-phosphate phosphatase